MDEGGNPIMPSYAPPEDVILNAIGTTNVPRVDEVGFSSHFTWGYRGDGPHDLAFNILLWSGVEKERARFLYRSFTQEFLMPPRVENHKAARIGSEEIAAWIWLQPAGVGAPW
jgi:hypothetical protein